MSTYHVAGVPYSSELYHHGIKGQRWGIRRFQNLDGSLTNAGKVRYGVGTHGEFMGQSRDNDIRIKAGTIANRISGTDKEIEDGQTFVSFDKLDQLKYIDEFSAHTIGGGLVLDGKSKNGYALEMRVTNDIIAPSYSKSMESFVRTISGIGVKEAAKIVSSQSKMQKEFIKNMKRFKVEECRDKAYRDFMMRMPYNDKLRNAFFNDLKKQGYNAIVDDNDVAFGEGMTKTALLVFDKGKNLKQTKAREITDSDRMFAEMASVEGLDVDYLSPDAKKRLNNMKKKWGL